MASMVPPAAEGSGNPGEESLIILQSLLCLMREKNLLTRADVEELCEKVDRRARGESKIPVPCCSQAAHNASGLMHRLATHIGQRYGGKHARN